MRALILQNTRDYLHLYANFFCFRELVECAPLFELSFLGMAQGKFSPALLIIVLGHKLKRLSLLFMTFYMLYKQGAEQLFSVASAVVFGLLDQFLRQRLSGSNIR